ncbi:probable F-box protein At2g36090 [Nymphaea colorata]|nr:probable F-box protein At2g36090 [Nymphaea colorata]
MEVASTPEREAAVTISGLHPDLLKHILHLLDGAALAAIGSTATEFRDASGDQMLWRRLVNESWPATSETELHRLIASTPGGFRAFYADSCPLVSADSVLPAPEGPQPSPVDLVSIVDVRHRGRIIFSKVLYGVPLPESGEDPQRVEDWFLDSPFRIDALDTKDDPPVISVAGGDCTGDEVRRRLAEDVQMSWIVLDLTRGRAVNLTSWTPLEVERYWYSDLEYQIKFGTVLPLERECIYCAVSVRCGGCEEGELKVREIAMTMEDVEGRNLLGRESMDIFGRALGSVRRKGEEVLKRKYAEFLRTRSENKERKAKRDKRIDMACVLSGVSAFVAFCAFMIIR